MLRVPARTAPRVPATLINPALGLTVVVCAAGFLLWWVRERRLVQQRRGLRALYRLSEEIVSARSPADIIRILKTTLPRVSPDASARLYLLRHHTNTLDLESGRGEVPSVSLPLDGAQGPAVCFRNRALLVSPDIRRSPFYEASRSGPRAGSAMLLPLLAGNDILGVLEIHHRERVRRFSLDQQAAAQHLANQIAIALKLMEQQSVREQLFRSEKLAAAGQLVSGLITELRPPLESMATRAALLVSRHHDSRWRPDLEAIAKEAKRASDIVSRLVSLARTEQSQATPVEINGLAGALVRFRESEWKASGIRVTSRLALRPLFVLGSRPQLEQVLLNLMVHAEQSQAGAEDRWISLATRLVAGRILVEIAYSSADAADPLVAATGGETRGLGLAVCQGIIQNHGGEIRFLRNQETGAAFEVELPAAPETAATLQPARPASRRSRRRLTTLLVEPEEVSANHLTALLSARGHRVVPASDGEQAADLAQRLRFDAVFCSIHLAGSNWIEFYQRVCSRSGAFVLLTEGYDTDLSRALPAENGFLLHMPVDETEFDRLLAAIEALPR